MSNVISAIASLPGWNISVFLLLAKATIILIAALGITLAMQRASATARHLVWLVALGTILLVPAMTAWAPIKVAVLPATETTNTPHAVVGAQPRSSIETGFIAPGSPSTSTQPTTEPVVIPGVMDRLSNTVSAMSALSLAFTIWGAVVAAILTTLALATLNVQRIVRRARPLSSPDWETPLYEIADRLGLEDAPRLLQSDDAKMPFACGMLKATIILPADSESWSLDRRRAVLLHELAHVRRHDLLGHTLGRLACAVYWFHPLVWKAAKQLRSESERACDDLALACGTRATDYAEHLLDIVTSVRGENTPLVALAMARRKEFEGRMLAILDPDLRHSAPTRKQSAALIGTLALVALTVGAVSPVARSANAATITDVAAKSHPTSSVVSMKSDSPVAIQMPHKAYPDSGIRGEQTMSYNKVEHTSTGISQSTAVAQSTSTNVQTLVNVQPDTKALERLGDAAADAGISISTAVLEMLGGKGPKGDKGSKAVSDDERPGLLAKILKTDSSTSLRRIAAWGLHEYASQKVAEDALVNAVRHDADARVREMSAWSLVEGDGRSGAVSDALASALKSDASDKVRATAAWGLAEVGDRGSMDALIAALADPNREVRIKAAWAIGSLEPKQAPKQIVALLGDSERGVRELAAWALFQIEDPSTIPALENALHKETDSRIQIAEIRALANLGEKSVDALRSLLESKDPAVKSMAVRALAGGNATGPWPWPWPDPRPQP